MKYKHAITKNIYYNPSIERVYSIRTIVSSHKESVKRLKIKYSIINWNYHNDYDIVNYNVDRCLCRHDFFKFF